MRGQLDIDNGTWKLVAVISAVTAFFGCLYLNDKGKEHTLYL